MAKGFNKVTLLGNLTRDPELRTTPSGRSVCSFSLAVNRTWNNQQGEKQEDVNFFDCTAWGKAGEIINQYTQKGQALLVSGRLNQSTWEQDGKKRAKVDVVVEDFNFISDGSRGGDRSSTQSNPAPSKSTSSPSKKSSDDVVIEDIDDEPVDLSDIPF
jgi:single-strand DNA-binding protein